MHRLEKFLCPRFKLSHYLVSIAYDPASPLSLQGKTDCYGLQILSGTFPDSLLPKERGPSPGPSFSGLHSLLGPSVGFEDEKRRRFTADQYQGSDVSDEPHRLPRNQHSRPYRAGACPARWDEGSYLGSPYRHCAPIGNSELRLGYYAH
jgi:hypothetical protein